MLKLKLKNIYFAWHHFAAGRNIKTPLVLLVVGSLSLVLPMGAASGHHMRHASQGMAIYYNNVSAIQSHGRNYEDVCMRGRLTAYIQDDCYEFTDEMGNSIEVQLEGDVNWDLVAKDQLIDLFGEIDRNMFRVKIDAKAFTIVEETQQEGTPDSKSAMSVVSVAVATPLNVPVKERSAFSNAPIPVKSQVLLSEPNPVAVPVAVVSNAAVADNADNADNGAHAIQPMVVSSKGVATNGRVMQVQSAKLLNSTNEENMVSDPAAVNLSNEQHGQGNRARRGMESTGHH